MLINNLKIKYILFKIIFIDKLIIKDVTCIILIIYNNIFYMNKVVIIK